MSDFKGLPDALARCRESSCTTGRDDTRISRYGVEPMTYGDLRKALALIDELAKALRRTAGSAHTMLYGACEIQNWDGCPGCEARALLAHTGLGGDDGSMR